MFSENEIQVRARPPVWARASGLGLGKSILLYQEAHTENVIKYVVRATRGRVGDASLQTLSVQFLDYMRL